MADSQNVLVWLDLEMTGLDVEKDVVIEIAALITDYDLNIIAEKPPIVIYQPEDKLNNMDDWNLKHHTESGLLADVRTSVISVENAEKRILEFITPYVPAQTSPLCGNSVYNDRMFMKRYMKALDNYLHYRLIDVSTLKELYKRWKPDAPVFEKKKTHRALDDIKESIEELKFYQKNFFRV